MGLSGTLRTMELPEILQWIERGQLTGTLEIESGSVRKQIVFKGGRFYSSASNDPREHLGQLLVRERLVTEEQLFSALLRQEEEGSPLGAILVEEGVLGEGDLRRALAAKVVESVYDLFLWEDGRFEFRDGEVPGRMAVHLDADVTGVIFEGARRADEWRRIRKVIPSSRATFKATGRGVGDEVEQAAVELAAAGKTMAAMALELHRSEFSTGVLLHELVGRGVLAVLEPDTEDLRTDPVVTLRNLLAQARRAQRERRFDDAVRCFEAVLLVSPLDQDAKKGLLSVAEARRRPAERSAVPLDGVPRLARDLQALTGERFEPLEGFVISRINGSWTVRAILKLCPVAEAEALRIFARLVERGVITIG